MALQFVFLQVVKKAVHFLRIVTMEASMAGYSVWHFIFMFIWLLPAVLGIFVFKQRPINLQNAAGNVSKVGRLGWSWTYFYFGFWVPLFRSEIGIAALHLLFTIITFGLFQPIWSFLYNKQHMTRLLNGGWEIHDSDEVKNYARKKLMTS